MFTFDMVLYLFYLLAVDYDGASSSTTMRITISSWSNQTRYFFGLNRHHNAIGKTNFKGLF
jgi:hypothetical protein